MPKIFRLAGKAGLLGLLTLWSLWSLWPASAEERVLRFHHFMPEKSPQHQDMYLPWAAQIRQATHGRMRIDVTGGMQLGGTAGELISQVEKRKVDIVFTLAGYTPGRFPRLEVFELPWTASSRAAASSQALYEFYERYAHEEFANLHLLAVWCHPSGVIMTRGGALLRPGDAAGHNLRVPSVVIGEALRSIGAKPKLIPLPQVVKQAHEGAIDGALFPYEIIPTIKLAGHFPHITEFAGHRGLYTAVFMIVMSKESYESLDAEERKVIDAYSGAALSAELGRRWDDIEEIGRDAFAAAGGEVTFVKGDDYEAWVRASEPAVEVWKANVARAGIDGDKLIAAAKELIAKYTARARNE
jgi:TRAP-type C4-dicarboxylate transport system substrate-binding protein